MAPFLKALLGWDIITTKFIKDKIQTLLPTKPSAEANEKEPSRATAAVKAAYSVIDEKTGQIRSFFNNKTPISKIYYKLWMAKRANRLPLIILTSFRILVSSFFIVTVVHKFLSENPRLTFALLLLTIFFVSRSRWLLDQYLKIENQFLNNLKGHNEEAEKE
jgi:hypothetical protein